MSLSMLTITGHLGKDPESKYNANGQEYCHFPVAVSNGKSKSATWYNVTCNNGLVKVAMDYLKKGEKVLVVGRFNPREYKNANGSPGISLDLVATNIELMGSSKSDKSDDSTSEDPTSFEPDKYEQEQKADTANNNSKFAAKSK